MLQITELELWGEDGRPLLRRVEPLSLRVEPGNMFQVVGPSGSGKSLLLAAISGMLNVRYPGASVTGSIDVFGTTVMQGEPVPRSGLVLESPYYQLSGLVRTVEAEVAVACEAAGLRREDVHDSIRWAGSAMGLSGIRRRSLRIVSGGELQRTVLAAHLALSPSLLLLDDALVELDPAFRDRFLSLLGAYCASTGAIACVASRRSEGSLTEGSHLVVRLGEGASTRGIRRKNRSRNKSSVVLDVRELSFSYPGSRQYLFQNLSFKVRGGEVLIVSGRNGCGKSTLGKLLVGLERPTVGEISIGDQLVEDVRSVATESLATYVFQNPDIMLSPSVISSVVKYPSDKKQQSAIVELERILGITRLRDTNVFDVPRVMRKRVALLRAAQRLPRVLVLDEPSIYEDVDGLASLVDGIEFLLSLGLAVVIISHDLLLNDAFLDAAVLRLEDYVPKRDERDENRGAKQGLSGPFGARLARQFVSEFWIASSDLWLEAMPETVKYWRRYVRPWIKTFLSGRRVESMVDLGCGHALYTGDIRRMASSTQHNVRAAGVDGCSRLLDIGRQLHRFDHYMTLLRSDIADSDETVGLLASHGFANVDLVTMIYVLHDDPEIKRMLRTAWLLLAPGGSVIATIVNPKRAEAMLEFGRLQPFAQESPDTGEPRLWDWMCMYPLPIENSYFEVPYFQRTIDTYNEAMTAVGFVDIRAEEVGSGGDILQEWAERETGAAYNVLSSGSTIALTGNKDA